MSYRPTTAALLHVVGFCMGETTGQRKRIETPKAADAFRRYLMLGSGRSLEQLAEDYVDRGLSKSKPSALTILKRWSSKYHWQARLRDAASDAADQMLRDAADLDADTFLVTSRLSNQRIKYAEPGHIDTILKIRESVRKPAPKGTSSTKVDVTVTITTEQREIAERIAESRGIPADDVIEEVEQFLRSQKV